MSDTIDMTTTRTRTYTPAECARHNARLHALRRWATRGADMLEQIIEAGSDDLRADTGVLTFEWAEPIAVRIERTECGWRRCHAEGGALFVVDPAEGIELHDGGRAAAPVVSVRSIHPSDERRGAHAAR